MKKPAEMLLKLLPLLCALALLFCSCSAKEQPGPTNMNNAPSNSTADSAVKHEVYADNSHKNSQVSVTYPVFSGADMQEINIDIYAFVKDFAELYYGQDYTDLQLELTFEVKRYDAEYLSIAFTGTGNIRTAAHANNLFLTKNYDLQKKQAITLSALHTIDRAFADALYAAAEEQFIALARQDSSFDAETMWEIFQADYPTADALLPVLQKCDSDPTSCQSYITRDAIGVSLPVSHVSGDHIEVEVAF